MYKINYLELNHFIRLRLTNTTHLRITPQTRVQVILGTNGSGKSSIFRELSPLPGEKDAFSANGSKIISITQRGHEYVLTNDFGKSHVHSFLKDGEELNSGGTVTVQRELVRQEFGIRQDIHDLLTGRERFSAMSPSRKREWFTQLSETSYDYAIAVYNKVATAKRDASGALKLAKKRLVMETAKLAEAQDITKIEHDIKAIVVEITLLYESRVDETRDTDTIDGGQQSLLAELQNLCQRLFHVKGHFANRQVFCAAELKDMVDGLRQELIQITTKIDVHTSEHTKLKVATDEYSKTGQEGVEALRVRRQDMVVKREGIWQRRKLGLVLNDPSTALTTIDRIMDNVHEVLSDLPPNPDKKYSQATLNQFKEQALAIREKLNGANERLERLKHEREHLEQMKSSDHTECPKCNHRWVVGFKPEHLDKIIQVINQGIGFVKDSQAKLVKLEEDIQAQEHYGRTYQEFARWMVTTEPLKPFWDHILKEEHVIHEPMNIVRLMGLCRQDLAWEVEAFGLDKQIQEVDHLIQIAQKASDVDMAHVKTRIDTLETDLGNLSRAHHRVKGQMDAQLQDSKRVAELDQLYDKIQGAQQRLAQGFTDFGRALRNEVINDCLNQLQIDLAQKQNQLNEIRMQRGIVQDIENNIKVLQQDEQALKLIEEELSPIDGLIAEGLLGFIRSFVRKVNAIVRKVWTYRMELQDCSVSSDDGDAKLDYRFPVLIKTADNRPGDVGLCSAGQREIFDLAFKIVAMRYLGMMEHPIFLDELGAAFDREHKTQVVQLIKYLIEQSSFSQIWIVSHDYEQYGALPGLQTCVLCNQNIVVPDAHNQHVEMA